MGIFDKYIEKRANEKLEDLSFEDLLLRAGLGKDSIDSYKAMQIPAVAGGVNLIADTVAMLPVKLYRKKEQDLEVEEIKNDKRTRLLNDETGDTLDAFQFKAALVRDYLLDGAGYAYINKIGNEIKSLHYVPKETVSVMTNTDAIYKDCNILVQGKSYHPDKFIRILKNTSDGMTGKGIVQENGEALAVAYNTQRYENKQSKTGGARGGFLQAEQRLDQDTINALKTSWRNMYGTDSDEKIVILNKGIEFKEATATSIELQLNERKQTNNEEISKLLHLPTDLLVGKYAEEIYVTAIKLAVAPILEVISKALNKFLLLESEKEDKYFAFDDKELMKGDTLKRYQAYALGIKNGFLQVDDVRYQENMPALGLDFVRLGLQDVLYDPKTKDVYTPNTGLSGKLGENLDKEEP